MKRIWLSAGTVLAILYLLLAYSVSSRAWQGWDIEILLSIQSGTPHWLDFPFALLSLLGSFEVTALFFGALLFLIFRPRDRILLMGLFLTIVAVEGLGKTLIYQPGVPRELHRYVSMMRMPTASVSTPYSFPSGHAARFTFLTFVLAMLVLRSQANRPVKVGLLAGLFTLEAVMLFSRVSLGDHWPADVLGGVFLGVLLALPAVDAQLLSPGLDRGWARLFTRSPDRTP